MRKLKLGGRVVAAFIGRYAVHRWLAWNDPDWIVRHPDLHEQLLRSGHVQRPGDAPEGRGLTDAYLAQPSEVVPLMEGCGLETLALIGCEGMVDSHEELLQDLADEQWQAWVDLNYRVSRDPALHGSCAHLLYVGQKPLAG
jgi:hypothetical protein